MASSAVVPSRANIIEIPAIVFCVVSPIIVSVRFWSRIKIHTKLGADDWVILAGLVSFLDDQTLSVTRLIWLSFSRLR